MSHLRRSLLAILIPCLFVGCGIQDSTQPPENSISAGPKNSGALVKTKTKSKKAVVTDKSK